MRFLLFTLAFSAQVFAQTAIYRSVQPGNTSAIATGTGNNLTISGSTATFAGALPDTIGVGCVIQYDADGDATVDNLAFVHGRTSSTVFTVKDSLGGTTYLNTVASDQDWSIFHAYTSLVNLEAGTENEGIAAGLRDFDGSDENLDIAGEKWFVALYSGVETIAVALEFTGWVTSTTDYPVFFTPDSLHYVGSSQRHSGIWSNQCYTIKITGGTSGVYNGANGFDHAEFHGIQFDLSAPTAQITGIRLTAVPATGRIDIISCIFKGNITTQTARGIWNDGTSSNANMKLYIRNSIFYKLWDSDAGSAAAIYTSVANNVLISNVTIDSCEIGIIRVTSGIITTTNAIMQRCGDGFNGSNILGDYNISNTDDAPGDSSYNALVVFENTTAEDYRLAVSDNYAMDRGVDLSGDVNFPFITDIVGTERPKGTRWDRGAYEYIALESVQQTDYHRRLPH